MSSIEKNEEKSGSITNILTINRPSPVRQYSERDNILSTIEDVESLHSLTPTRSIQHKDHLLSNQSTREDSPFSAFYEHNPSRSHLEATSEAKSHHHVAETDLEAGLNSSQTNVLSPYSSSQLKAPYLSKSNAPCSVWPGRQQLKERRNQMRLTKGWHPLARFDKRTRILIKIAIGVLLIGIVTAIGLLVTKAVGGGIWKSDDNPSTHG